MQQDAYSVRVEYYAGIYCIYTYKLYEMVRQYIWN
jgi:hypothetical protein